MSLTVFSRLDRLLLEAEVAPGSREEFSRRYRTATGVDAFATEYCQIQPDKWGIECRVYFDAEDWVVESLERLGYHVEDRLGGGYHSDYMYSINSQESFWRLVEHGYRLGPNEPTAA